MQTIDLGTISIGGEDLSASIPAPEVPAAGEVMEETSAVETLFAQSAPAGEACETCREAPCEEAQADRVKCREGGDEICFEKCEDYKHCHLDDAPISGQGRILDLSLRLKNVCPGKRVAVGVMLCEKDAHGHEYPRGLKTFTVGAHRHGRCADIPVETIRFILPEDIGVGMTGDACGCRRHFVVRVSAHYIDFSSVGATL